jgi:CheY-like chemotaxis protein
MPQLSRLPPSACKKGRRAVPRILVIDDQNHARTAIVLALKGFEVVEAESGQLGMTKFAQSEFDVVVADIFLPGIDGVTLIKSMRTRNAALPIVAMSGVLLDTAGGTALDQLRNISDLADVVRLQKPFRPHELVQAVNVAMAGDGAWPKAARPRSQRQT